MRTTYEKEKIEKINTIISVVAIVIALFSSTLSLLPRYNLLSNDIEKKAEDGDIASQLYLGQIYFESLEYADSYYWFRKATLNKDCAELCFAYASLGYLGNIGFYSNKTEELSYNLERINVFYDKALYYAHEYNVESDKLYQIQVNYLFFLLSNNIPTKEVDSNGNEIAKQDDNTKNDFLHNNISTVKDTINEIYELKPNIFSNIELLHFPVDNEKLLEKYIKKYPIVKGTWKYDYTTISNHSGLAFSDVKEKLVYVNSFDELVDAMSFTTITKYKYYHYVLTDETSFIPTDLTQNMKQKFINYSD